MPGAGVNHSFDLNQRDWNCEHMNRPPWMQSARHHPEPSPRFPFTTNLQILRIPFGLHFPEMWPGSGLDQPKDAWHAGKKATSQYSCRPPEFFARIDRSDQMKSSDRNDGHSDVGFNPECHTPEKALNNRANQPATTGTIAPANTQQNRQRNWQQHPRVSLAVAPFVA